MYSFLIEGRRTHGRLPGAFPVPLLAQLGTTCTESCGSCLVCLTGGIPGGLENRYGKILKSPINI